LHLLHHIQTLTTCTNRRTNKSAWVCPRGFTHWNFGVQSVFVEQRPDHADGIKLEEKRAPHTLNTTDEVTAAQSDRVDVLGNISNVHDSFLRAKTTMGSGVHEMTCLVHAQRDLNFLQQLKWDSVIMLVCSRRLERCSLPFQL